MAEDKKIRGSEHAPGGYGGRARHGERRILNVFDIFIIFIVLLAIALPIFGVHVSGLLGLSEDGEPCTISYVLVFSGVDSRFADAVATGDTALTEAGGEIGTVTACSRTPHRVLRYLPAQAEGESGVGVWTEDASRVDITVTVTAQAAFQTGTGYMVGGEAFRVGDTLNVRFPGYFGAADCTDLRVTERRDEP